jgi:catechol 2,3-dioxygenase
LINEKGKTMLYSTMSHISLNTPDPTKLAQFYKRVLGMNQEPNSPGEAIRLGWGRGHYAVELVQGTRGLGHFAFEIVDGAGQTELEARLAAAGLTFERANTDTSLPNEIVLTDPDGNILKFHGEVDRSGERSFGLRPERIQHIALATPDVSRLMNFYVDVLGFRVSDAMGDDEFVWLRSDHFHHSLALAQRKNQRGLDHYSFDISGWNDFKVWCDHLAREKVPVLWGPGRHGPGNNLFIMFRDGDGSLVEFSAEMELYWDDVSHVIPKQWQHVGGTVSLWGPWPDFRQETV